MGFIARSESLPRSDCKSKIIKGKDFWVLKSARQVIDNANLLGEEIISSANKSYIEEQRRGYREGWERARFEESAHMIAIVSQTVEYFARVESQMVDLVLEAVQKIISDFSDREKVSKVVKNLLILFRNQRLISINVHPTQCSSISENIKILRTLFPAIEHIEVHADSSLQLDACIIESDIGRVEASIQSQIEAMRSTFEQVFGNRETEFLGKINYHSPTRNKSTDTVCISQNDDQSCEH